MKLTRSMLVRLIESEQESLRYYIQAGLVQHQLQCAKNISIFKERLQTLKAKGKYSE